MIWVDLSKFLWNRSVKLRDNGLGAEEMGRLAPPLRCLTALSPSSFSYCAFPLPVPICAPSFLRATHQLRQTVEHDSLSDCIIVALLWNRIIYFIQFIVFLAQHFLTLSSGIDKYRQCAWRGDERIALDYFLEWTLRIACSCGDNPSLLSTMAKAFSVITLYFVAILLGASRMIGKMKQK